jgi:hypothetical protein
MRTNPNNTTRETVVLVALASGLLLRRQDADPVVQVILIVGHKLLETVRRDHGELGSAIGIDTVSGTNRQNVVELNCTLRRMTGHS